MCQSLFVVTLYSQMSVGADGCHETHYYNMILRKSYMRIGIIVAMESELKLLIPLIDGIEERVVSGTVLYEGKVGEHEVSVLQCGIGKVNAAMGAMKLINNFSPQCVINSGVAGGTGAGAKVLDVVAGERVGYHDVWCGSPNEPGQVQGLPRYFRADEGLLALLPEGKVKRGLIASGDMFVDSVEELNRIKSIYPDSIAVDMESAAIAQVCHSYNIPFLSLRVVSDTPGETDNAAQYHNFWQEAPQCTFEIIKEFISKM